MRYLTVNLFSYCLRELYEHINIWQSVLVAAFLLLVITTVVILAVVCAIEMERVMKSALWNCYRN